MKEIAIFLRILTKMHAILGIVQMIPALAQTILPSARAISPSAPTIAGKLTPDFTLPRVIFSEF